jgi:hypothetical protein
MVGRGIGDMPRSPPSGSTISEKSTANWVTAVNTPSSSLKIPSLVVPSAWTASTSGAIVSMMNGPAEATSPQFPASSAAQTWAYQGPSERAVDVMDVAVVSCT